MDSELKIQSWKRSQKRLPNNLTFTQKANNGDQIYTLDISMANGSQIEQFESEMGKRGLKVSFGDEAAFGQDTANTIFVSHSLKAYATRYTLENKLSASPSIATSRGRVYGLGKSPILETRIALEIPNQP